MSKASRDTGEVYAPRPQIAALPPPGKKAVYICTSAQSNTVVHPQVWRNLMALAEHDKAIVLVGSITYSKAQKGGKRKTAAEGAEKEEWWDKNVEPHLFDQSVALAPGLIWCGELNILPTAVDPISGLESYTGRLSAILPHTKFALKSVPSPKHSGTKFVYTTGAVTKRNYIQKKAGQKAEFHHGYGGLIVEVDSDGNWFVRQLNADSDGVIYDLDRCAKDGAVTTGHRPECIVWGDIHESRLERDMREIGWGAGGILDTLKPKYQVFHDLIDFRPRNHHDLDDSWKMFEKHVSGGEDVYQEIYNAAKFLAKTARPWCESLVVCSNHDMAFVRWLKEADFRADPKNAVVFLRENLAAYEAIRDGDKNYYAVEQVVQRVYPLRVPGKFLRRDERFLIRPDAGGGIDVGMHGDVGANGGRNTSLQAFARTGRKCIIGHSHTAGIFEGAMQVGVMGPLDQGYNEGMSSWSHTNALVYPNGKRTLFTIWEGRWRG